MNPRKNQQIFSLGPLRIKEWGQTEAINLLTEPVGRKDGDGIGAEGVKERGKPRGGGGDGGRERELKQDLRKSRFYKSISKPMYLRAHHSPLPRRIQAGYTTDTENH